MLRIKAILLTAMVALTSSIAVSSKQADAAVFCPFCTAAGQTLRQEMESMDVVAIATLVDDGREEIDGSASFKVQQILKGDQYVKVGDAFSATYFGPGKSDKPFLLQGVDPRELVWSSPVPLSKDAEGYVTKLLSLPEDAVGRLKFFQEYFEHEDTLLSRDCYDEFAITPYEDILKLKEHMKHDSFVKWVKDPAMPPDRKRLYYTLLGVCGTKDDPAWMEEMIKSTKPEDRAGLDSLIAAYLNLKGEDGLPVIVDLFLKNPDSQYVDIFAAVMALRFHSTEGKALKKENVAKAMVTLLDRPDLADLVIPDLARMEDWSQLDRLTQLFKEANEDNAWIRMPIVNYARACPLPEAKERLKEMEEVDPAAVKRSKTFFPIPIPAGDNKGGASYSRSPKMFRVADASSVEQRRAFERMGISRSNLRVASLPGVEIDLLSSEQIEAKGPLNLSSSLAVVGLASLVATTFMWLVATRNG